MSKPRLEDGYTRIANELLEALARVRISNESMRVFFVILRLTYGWSRKCACIRNKTFSEATGIDRRHVKRAISKLTTAKIVFVTQNGDKSYPNYCINKNYDEWIDDTKPDSLSPKQGTSVTHSGDKASPKEVTAKPLNPLPTNGFSNSKEIKKIYKESTPQRHSKSDDSWHLKFAERFYQLMPEYHNLKYVKEQVDCNFKDWVDTLERLEQTDGISRDRIAAVLKFAREDDFWRGNLVSLSALRNRNKDGLMKFEQIEVRLKNRVPSSGALNIQQELRDETYNDLGGR